MSGSEQEILAAVSEAREVAGQALDHSRAASGQSATATGRADLAARVAQQSEVSSAQAMMVAVEVHAELRAAAGLQPDPDHIFEATRVQLEVVSSTAEEVAENILLSALEPEDTVYTGDGSVAVGADGQPLAGVVMDPFAGAGEKGDPGEDGSDGLDGWTPRFAVAQDGARRVLQILSWFGGQGTPPPVGYLADSGITQVIANAIDLRGPAGSGGGGSGLTPVAAKTLLANTGSANALPAAVGLNRALSFRDGKLSAPLPFRLNRPKILAFGDSITARQGITSYATWSWIRSRCRFDYQAVGYNRGISGNTTLDLLNRIEADVFAYSPDIIWLAIGTNDAGAFMTNKPGYTFEEIKARILTIVSMCLERGIQVWLVTVRARGPAGTTDAAQYNLQQKMIHRINTLYHQLADSTPGVMLFDNMLAWSEPATGYPADAYVYPALGDQTHPSPKGALAESDVYVPYLAQILHAGMEPHLVKNPLDVYDATLNPTGNLLANGLLSGTGGTVSTGVTGTVATSWNVNTDRASGWNGTIAASMETNGRKGWRQVITVADRVNPSGTDDASFQEIISFTQTIPMTGNFAVGDVLQAMCDFEVSASGLIAAVALEARYYAGGSGDLSTQVPAPMSRYEEGPTTAYSGILMPDPIVVTAPGASAASFRVRGTITVIGRSPGAFVTAKFGQMTLRCTSKS